MTTRRGLTLALLAVTLLLSALPAGAAMVDAATQLDRALTQSADTLDAAARKARLDRARAAVIPHLRLPQASPAGATSSPSLDLWLRAQLDQIRKDRPAKAQAARLVELATSLRRAAQAGLAGTAPPFDPAGAAQRILAQRAYQSAGAGPAPAPRESLLERVGRWLQDRLVELFTRIFGATASRPIIGQVVAALFIALLVFAAVYLVFALASLIARRPRRETIDEGTPLQAQPEPDALYQLGMIAASQGRYAVAVSFLFQASLASLDRAGLLAYDGSLTAGEYRRAVRRTANAASPHFDAIAQCFVLAAFAERPVSKEDWSTADAAYRSLRPLLAS